VSHETHFNPVSGKCNLATNYLHCHAEPVEEPVEARLSKHCHAEPVQALSCWACRSTLFL